ncbi:hypothetical protein PsorP6_019403 [Peronosclerospora sorghi]|nr:hypothetical protein PsorP6_019403 [Peronosclerospora sorghi]
MTRVYLDYNATTPVEPSVLQPLLPYLGPQFSNASSSYALGQTAKKAVAMARNQESLMLGASDPSEIVFLSGGTESISYAIKGAALAAKRISGRIHIITFCVEHVAILETIKWLQTQGFQVTYLPVDRFGCVRIQDVLDSIAPQTCVVSIMLANSEVSSLHPVAEISQVVRQFVKNQENDLPIVVHTDASQAIGKARVNVQDLGVDLLTISGHKLYAPKGFGAIYVRDGIVLDTLIHGASQENGCRGGTENVELIVALGQACALVEMNLHEYAIIIQETGRSFSSRSRNTAVLRKLATRTIVSTQAQDQHVIVTGKTVPPKKEKNLERHSEPIAISHVLVAMHVAPEFAKGTLRLSLYHTRGSITRC